MRTPYGIRTRATALKGRRPRPLDEGGRCSPLGAESEYDTDTAIPKSAGQALFFGRDRDFRGYATPRLRYVRSHDLGGERTEQVDACTRRGRTFCGRGPRRVRQPGRPRRRRRVCCSPAPLGVRNGTLTRSLTAGRCRELRSFERRTVPARVVPAADKPGYRWSPTSQGTRKRSTTGLICCDRTPRPAPVWSTRVALVLVGPSPHVAAR